MMHGTCCDKCDVFGLVKERRLEIILLTYLLWIVGAGVCKTAVIRYHATFPDVMQQTKPEAVGPCLHCLGVVLGTSIGAAHVKLVTQH